MTEDLKILYEDNHLFVVSKPAGIATMGLPDGEETLLIRAKRYIKERYEKPGLVYLGVVSRLDFPVSGVVVFARTSKAAARLNEQFRDHDVNKIYHAIVEGSVSPKESRLVNHLCEDKRRRKMWITSRPVPESKESALRYRLVEYLGNLSLLEITLETGRKHQIRVQLSHIKHPILGDIKYGSRHTFPEGIALHAKRLTLLHPVTKKPTTFESPYPDCWKKFI
ncbi:MAG: RluA family pseudouridine synthase [Planctomycetaceae bacterium]|jgi:23S rRNA pseudouridine1911/1915/1917 synthase|nr:RluA family pseudouridine synthase [Planctomycetaceae bacterium]